jgi:hypothetical protein
LLSSSVLTLITFLILLTFIRTTPHIKIAAMPLIAALVRPARATLLKSARIYPRAAFASLAQTQPTLPSKNSLTDTTTSTSTTTDNAAKSSKKKHIVFGNRGPSLQDFLNSTTSQPATPLDPTKTTPDNIPYLSVQGRKLGAGAKYFVEVYGCQMNVNDTEILMAIMNGAGYTKADDQSEADIVFLVTCAIRENAETRIWNRLADLKRKKLGPQKDRAPLVGVLGVRIAALLASSTMLVFCLI